MRKFIIPAVVLAAVASTALPAAAQSYHNRPPVATSAMTGTTVAADPA